MAGTIRPVRKAPQSIELVRKMRADFITEPRGLQESDCSQKEHGANYRTDPSRMNLGFRSSPLPAKR